MSINKYFILIIILILSCNSILFIAYDGNEANLNIVEVNDIAQSLVEKWETIGQGELPGLRYGLDYVVLDEHNQFVAATRSGLNQDLNTAISNRDTIVELSSNNTILGKLIIYNHTNQLWYNYKIKQFTFSMIFVCIIVLFSYLYLYHIKKTILHPFHKLQFFAKQVAEGNLDYPLEMDEGNHFGAFTESFDIMREELKKARENERIANQSKKELVASLSHDIKTPVASIKAVSEIMMAKSSSKHEIKQLEIINSKADQINSLITNMFHATLEELQELKVHVTEEESSIIFDLIQEADFQKLVTITNEAECIILMDHLRLTQVIDNIISNSYKYAGTSIRVSTQFTGKYLEISFQDFGLGVSDDEIPLLFNKYYRANNSEGKSGTGLGLYISKYLMNQMQGDITCDNTEDGFLIMLKLLIA